MQLNEPGSVASARHQIGVVHQAVRQYEAAEYAYQESLRIKTQVGDTAGQASTLHQLGNLYNALGRLEDSVRFHLQASVLCAALHYQAYEVRARCNAAIGLITLRRYDDARQELQRAIECNRPFGHAVEPWNTFNTLSNLERTIGNASAAAEARQQALDTYLAIAVLEA
jgi:tetratricopeptide (TPR) repeat protein